MTLADIWNKYQMGNDFEDFLKAFQSAIPLEQDKARKDYLWDKYKKMVTLYWNMKNNMFDRNIYNMKIDLLMPEAVQFIQEKVMEFPFESYDDDSFKIPDFAEQKKRKEKD